MQCNTQQGISNHLITTKMKQEIQGNKREIDIDFHSDKLLGKH
jgi:cellobiose-specific phosphotransferase system component IIB